MGDHNLGKPAMTLTEEPWVVDEYIGALLRDGIQSHCRKMAANTAVPGYKAVMRLSKVVKAAAFLDLKCHLGLEN